MKAYRISHGGTIDGLRLENLVDRPLAPYEVRIEVKAVSLNYRDLMIANGAYPVKIEMPIIPCSDGAGDVVAVGSMVTRVGAIVRAGLEGNSDCVIQAKHMAASMLEAA